MALLDRFQQEYGLKFGGAFESVTSSTRWEVALLLLTRLHTKTNALQAYIRSFFGNIHRCEDTPANVIVEIGLCSSRFDPRLCRQPALDESPS
jgi:hypothetical protein